MSEYDQRLNRFMAYVVAQEGWREAVELGAEADPQDGTVHHIGFHDGPRFRVTDAELRDHDAAGSLGGLAQTKVDNAMANPGPEAAPAQDMAPAEAEGGEAAVAGAGAGAPPRQLLMPIAEPATMSRGDRARLVARGLDELAHLLREDPAFDLARGYLAEARQVLPVNAE